jgi:hypothetical protein
MGKDESLCQALNREDLTAAEPRPRDTSLDCQLWDQTFSDCERPAFEESLAAMALH